METVSVSTSKSLSVCNIYIHEQSFRQKKLIPGLPSGFEDRWDKKLLLKKKLLKAIENNFIKFGAEALETPSFEISENIGSFLAEDDANPMSDVFSFQDGEKSITLRYDLSSPLARFVAQNNQELQARQQKV